LYSRAHRRAKPAKGKTLTVASHFHAVNASGLLCELGLLRALCVNSSSFFFFCYIEPMTLSEKIQKDLTDAMRSKDELRLSVLRGVKSAIKYKETEKIRTLDEAETIQILQTLVKQRKESIDQFGKGNRQDLVDKETKELAILESYLPASASDAEMDAAIAKAIAETAATSIKQMGAVVKAAKAHLEGKVVDGKALSDRVRARLS